MVDHAKLPKGVLMETLKNIGKFILGAIIKVFVIILVVLLVWLILCIFIHDGFGAGLKAFINSKLTHLILGWIVGSWIGIYEGIKEGSIQKVVIGVFMFFTPLILIAISTPNPDIELYDSSGNLWKLRKG